MVKPAGPDHRGLLLPGHERCRRRSLPVGWRPAVQPPDRGGNPEQQRGLVQRLRSASDAHRRRIGDLLLLDRDAPRVHGILTGIPYCPEADIALARTKTGTQEEAEPSCPAASLLGHSLVGTGAGPVLAYTPGEIYLAGPYDGDPFSLVSVTSAVVGPFDLGTVVIRFGLRVDPRTAQISVDPTASEPIPTILDGIVTHVRDIRVYIDRPNFTLNPTSCEPSSISSTLTSSLSQTATISSRFQAASCANLKFTPALAASTAAKASRSNGASLVVKIAYPKGAIGSQAWFNYAKFTIPSSSLALTTLQKACLARSSKPNARTARRHRRSAPPSCTPRCSRSPRRPRVFVSYGGAAFPRRGDRPQGDGVTIELDGHTLIEKGVTSATFNSLPTSHSKTSK